VTLAAGTRLGPYEIVAPIGAGGMGEVYRARDSRLSRDVAIKVLPEALVRDGARLTRFRREAQVLASLNHPHIAAIYGVEEQGGQEALILELVEGETLAERIAAGPVPVEEALEIARQIARALEAAHEKGIVHRDLKPANVKLDRAGHVKVLDFGLAKALSIDGSSPDATSSPTLTAASTQAGVIIGTAAYMSPEQARGKTVDKRADIWAFGTVLYEMLTGRKTFEGETVSDTLAAVLTKEPDWSALPAETPASVKRVLRRCLDRDPKTRIHDIADARLELDEAPLPPAGAVPIPGSSRLPVWAWLAGIVLALAAAVGWWRAMKPAPTAPTPVTGFAVTLPQGQRIPFDDLPVVDISRDGSELVYVGDTEGHRLLYLRSRDRIEPRPVAGSDGAYSPFFSPDGQWIGFFAEGKLRKIPAAGGVAIALADAPNNRGGVWLDDGTIVFAPHFTSGLQRVSSGGGQVETLTTPDPKKGERSHRWPSFLPGGSAVLFTIGLLTGPGNYDDARIAVWEPATRQTRIVFEGGSMGRFAPPNHLLFWRAGTFLASTFDVQSRRIEGEPVVLTEKMASDPSSGVAYAAVSAGGTLAYVPGNGGAADERRLFLTDRSGKPRPLPVPPRSYHYPRFSPDGKRLAFSIGPGHGNSDDVWTCEIATGALARLTFGDGNGNYCPVWSPDGKQVAFSSDRAHQGTFFKNADGSGEETPLHPEARPQLPQDWSRDGSRLAIINGFPNSDILTVSLSDRRERLIKQMAGGAVFSPDGRWIAYATLVSAGNPPQIVVEPADGSGGRVQITSDVGSFPVWTDRELIFLSRRKVVAVETQTQPTFRAGPAQTLFEFPYDPGSLPLREFDVTRDGQTFVFVGSDSGTPLSSVDVIVGWSSALARQLPEKPK
jgi:eukaryotic-like serine/threonine-protein kinase